VPLAFTFADLPLLAQRGAILDALQSSQVLIVAGETGSGKSTQLPQYCLQSGRGMAGMIAHTQPRRLAARALAARISEELAQPVGRSVGFKVRFADQVSDATRLVLMTDGLLLAELASDPTLSRYDTLIVDEAHERSLNVDLLLGVLKRLLPRRPELKLIVTSATLDVERICAFFGNAPVVRAGGRGHPIEVRYCEAAADDDDPDLPLAVCNAYEQIAAEPGDIGRGDVLVFLPGEREIRDVQEYLERELHGRVEVLPLYSRLSWEQQQRIFQPGSRQRIVLSTNVAETSVTVPGIRSVIDSGLARVSRYSPRNRLQRLPIEAISVASAEQRKGRCGRVGAGLCLRLYSQQQFEARPPFTEPEVLRTNLAALLLRLAADALGDAEDFPFIDAPDSRALNDGYRLLQELQALDAERRITSLGKAMARLPLDPRLARALIESKRHHAESELLAIVAALSVADVRTGETRGTTSNPPPEDAEATALFDNRSEFSGLVKLWRAYRNVREGPRRALRTWCKERRFSLLRFSEWEDVHGQVAERARDLGIVSRGWSASYAGVHRALLAGFCTLVGSRGEEGKYLSTRGVHFYLFPGSPLARRKPRWVMAANIIETSRVFARRVAQIEPAWIEAAGAHLLKREYLSPDWDERREEVVARERISFLGLTLSANRLVNYGPIAPEESRRIFAREALSYRRLTRRPEWLMRNDAALLAAQHLEERLRTRGLVHNPEGLAEFYDRALPRQVSSGATLEFFSRHLKPEQRAALTLDPEHIFARRPDPAALAQFPESVTVGEMPIAVQYRFAPGEADDGATLMVPSPAVPQLSRADVQSAIPGFSAPRIEAMLRSLPKEARRSLIPIPAAAQDFLEFSRQGAPADAPLLAAWLKTTRGIPEALLRFQAAAVPEYLNPQVAAIEGSREIARGADLTELRQRCAAAARKALEEIAGALYGPAAWRRFEPDQLPLIARVAVAPGFLTLYPTLGAQQGNLTVQLEWSQEEAAMRWFDSAVRLACSMLPGQVRGLAKKASASTPLILSASPYLSSRELIDTLTHLTVRKACFGDQEAPRTRVGFEEAVDRGREQLHQVMDEMLSALSGWLAEAAAVRRLLDEPRVRGLDEAAEESREHLHGLLNGAAIQGAAPQWLRQLPRYLKAEQRRWQRNAARGAEPAQILQQIRQFRLRLRHLHNQVSAQLRTNHSLEDLKFWIEEFRVSLYAQELKTMAPISAARLEQRAAEIDAWVTR
jgi:ATP-dependent helicase HrpA